MLIKIIAGLALALFLALVLINAFRPSLFRFESVGPTAREAVLSALEARITKLDQLSYEQLAALPEQHIDRTRIDGRDVLFQTMRTSLPDGGVELAILVAVREPAGIVSRPVRVAARGFRIRPGETHVALPAEELAELAMDVSSAAFYEH